MAQEEIKQAGIDRDVLNILNDEQILASLSDEKSAKRFELNCFCELLSQLKELNKEFDEFAQLLSVCSAQKLADFFRKLNENVEQERKNIELQEKMKKSHKKPAKNKAN